MTDTFDSRTDRPTAPSLSIAVNNHNYGKYLGEALDSVLDQMAEGDELIVVDDGSTDESAEVLRQYEGRPAVRVIRQENAGQVAACLAGIRAAGGEVVLLLDSDDYYLPGYLERIRVIYTQEPTVSMVFSTPELFGPETKDVAEMRETLQHISYEGGVLASTKWASLLFFEFVGTPTSGISMRRELAQRMLLLAPQLNTDYQHNELPAKLLRVSIDAAAQASIDATLARCASVLDAIRFIDPEPGFGYRIHGKNKFAALPRRGQLYVRLLRKKSIIRALRNTYELPDRPTSLELGREIENRSWPRSARRRLSIRLRYAFYAFTSRGSWQEKAGAIMAALGSPGR